MVGLVRVRSPLLTESRLISFPPVTEMFHFTGFAIPSLFYSGRGDRIQSCQVTPFGNRRVSGCVPLTDAYRSLSRPSSPPSTKAFTLCPLLLDFFSQILRSQSWGAYLPSLGFDSHYKGSAALYSRSYFCLSSVKSYRSSLYCSRHINLRVSQELQTVSF